MTSARRMPKVAPPVIHPEATAQAGVVKVTIDDEAEPGASLFYTLDGTEASIENATARHYDGAFYLTTDTAVRARAFVPGKLPSDEARRDYTLSHDGGSGSIGVAIESPSDSAQVSSPTPVVGYVNSPNLAYWKLTARLLDGNVQPKLIAQGQTNQAAHSNLGIFDPTLLLNGLYELRL